MLGRRCFGVLSVPFVFVFAMGCHKDSSGPIDPPDPQDPPVEQPLTTADKVDLLLVVDNSISMADKQAILAPSVRHLITQLVNPPCVDSNGDAVAAEDQPSDPEAACPSGTTRASAPVTDLHVGIISSALGDMGSGGCSAPVIADGNDRAHLVARSIDGAPVSTYQGGGFLAWDPQGELVPAGESNLENLLSTAEQMVVGVGELGCGYEMPLEATYRFLSDPAPYDSLEVDQNQLTKVGVDTELLDQRAAFVRPDSLVAVVLLSDENDCSLDTSGQGFLAFAPGPFYRSTSVCETDPNDACCTSCGLATPEGCTPDPICAETPKYTQEEDHQNLKCWDQKRRYGMDFLNPVARYTNALSQAHIDPTSPDLAVDGDEGVQNPLFAGGRPASFVTLTAIVGVPWQDLATDPSNPRSPFKSTAQMEQDGTWEWLIGQSPRDPFMRETTAPRSGTSPATGESVSADNSINGGDWSNPDRSSLQHACIFELENAIPEGPDCSECVDASCDNPLCVLTDQVAAKAYPGTRQLELVRALGNRGIAGSVCPAILPGDAPDPTMPNANEGYDAAMSSLEQNVRAHLEQAGDPH